MMPSEKYFQTAFLRPKQSMPPTVLKSPLPRPIPRCRCLPTSTSVQRLRFVRRKAETFAKFPKIP